MKIRILPSINAVYFWIYMEKFLLSTTNSKRESMYWDCNGRILKFLIPWLYRNPHQHLCSCSYLNCNTKQATINYNYFQFTVHDLLHTVSVQLAHHYVTGQIIYP